MTPPRVTVLTGAGISTASGIPDFRGPQGVWTADPQAAKLVDIDHYLADARIRAASWQARRRHPAWAALPSTAHRALAAFAETGALRALLTQNIDSLHQAAGSRDVVELHGSMREVQCVDCGARTPTPRVLARLDADPDPRCERCGGVQKTTVVMFGEPLDPMLLEEAFAAAEDCEVFLAVGTSLSVHPVAALAPNAVRAGARLVVVNAEPTPYDDLADRLVRDPIDRALPPLLEDLAAGRV